MPKSNHPWDIDDECYNESKSLRLSETSKRLRRLKAFERIYYKKTCEVKKTYVTLPKSWQYIFMFFFSFTAAIV
jgi:hypothetical protein